MRRTALARLAVAVATAALAALTVTPAAPAAAARARPPVVMIVLDEFPVADLMTPEGELDAQRFPGFAQLARAATWFPNAYTVHDSTPEAVPALLDGRMPRPGSGTSYRTHPRSVFTFMQGLGYKVRAREEATTICPPRVCPRVRHYGNPGYNILHRRRERLDGTIASIRASRQPTFTFHHSVLPHVPWAYLPSGHARQGYEPGTLPDFSSRPGFADSFLTEHNEQRHLLQAGFVDREIGRLVKRLKQTGQWRASLVVVTADHGLSFRVGSRDRRKVTEANVHEVAPVPMFIKVPGGVRAVTSPAYASTIDVVPTIAHLLGARLGWKADGRQAFSPEVAGRTGVAIERRDLSGVLRIQASEMEARRRADRLERASTFGTGPWWRVYRIGPNRRLLGQRAPGAKAGARGPVARVVVPRATNVSRGATTVPTLVAGRIERGSATANRDLAVAVNGRIAAVGRSFHLTGKRTEWFSLNLPEWRLRRGKNAIAIYEVGADKVPRRLAAAKVR